MSMSIGSSTSTTSAMMFSRAGATRQRPDASKLAEDLFSKLDTQSKGYLEASDLATALGSSSSTSTDSSSTASADEVFKALDSDSDGKLTKSELTSGLKQVQEQLDSQFQAMRTKGKGDMPPPPPEGEEDTGLSQDDMDDIASSTTDSTLADMMKTLSSNFEAADTDGDGKVTRSEAMEYKKSTEASTASTDDSTSTDTDTTASSDSVSSALASLVQGMMQPPPKTEGGHHGGKGKDDGLTVDQMNEIASTTTDTNLADLMKTLSSNFAAADANQDGKVTRDEAMAYQEENQTTTSATTTASASSSSDDLDTAVMKRIMELVQTYSGQSSSKAQSTLSTVSISA